MELMGKENDRKWSNLNKALLEAMKHSNWSEMQQLYNDMAFIVAKEGKDALYLLKERNRAELMGYQSVGIEYVQIITARNFNNSSKYSVCPACRPLEGKVMTVGEALKTMPIPPSNCTGKVFKNSGHFCRCSYIATRENGE